MVNSFFRTNPSMVHSSLQNRKPSPSPPPTNITTPFSTNPKNKRNNTHEKCIDKALFQCRNDRLPYHTIPNTPTHNSQSHTIAMPFTLHPSPFTLIPSPKNLSPTIHPHPPPTPTPQKPTSPSCTHSMHTPPIPPVVPPHHAGMMLRRQVLRFPPSGGLEPCENRPGWV